MSRRQKNTDGHRDSLRSALQAGRGGQAVRGMNAESEDRGMKEKVVVGMSGGVDSSVAAYLLKEQGYEVIGVTMELWREEGGCCGLSAAEDAKRVAHALDIPFYVVNFREAFQKNVVDYFVAEYLRGRTPNPCIACNRYVKWEALLRRALQIGADYIATGHYARTQRLPNGRYALRSSVSSGKDQTYALYNLTQFQLAHTLMPVGMYEKEQIRELARGQNLPVADKPDSQDICFVPQGDYAGFIERQAPGRVPGEGNFVSPEGTVLGRHRGITHYTVGQRRGLGLSMGHPVFVCGLRPETNEVVISDSDVYRTGLTCNQISFMGLEDLREPVRLRARVRYAHQGEWCMVRRTGQDELSALFEKPVRAITPGQAVVFYDGEYVAAGGIIA